LTISQDVLLYHEPRILVSQPLETVGNVTDIAVSGT
jgi:hypothetical protein